MTRAVRLFAYTASVDMRKMSELTLYLEGSELVTRETLSPPALRPKDLRGSIGRDWYSACRFA
ncbi:MAG: hypothetical protein JWN04_261 [Myxococcaceae bacterium]|nr:hypothetical protein [Myxococcaceae bacterium]